MPAFENVSLNVAPFESVWLPNEPSSAVTVCPTLSLFVQVTVVPTTTVTDPGLNEKFWIVTLPPPAAAELAAVVAALEGAADEGVADSPDGAAAEGLDVADGEHAASTSARTSGETAAR